MQNIELPTDGGQNVWTSVWPTREGVYWFYGYPWGRRKIGLDDSGPDLLNVRVRKVSNGVLHITEGWMLSKAEGAVGLWTDCPLPAMPSATNVTDDGKQFRA